MSQLSDDLKNPWYANCYYCKAKFGISSTRYVVRRDTGRKGKPFRYTRIGYACEDCGNKHSCIVVGGNDRCVTR